MTGERARPENDPARSTAGSAVESTAGPVRHVWFDPTFGAAGDMLLGALLGLGAPVGQVRAGLDGLGVDGWTLDHATVERSGLSAHRAEVDAPAGHHHRSWSSIDTLLAGADLPTTVSTGARATFRRLGEVEAAIHRVDLDQVHFHEVGALDAIVDIVGSWLALHLLGAAGASSGPVGLGSGTTTAAHGRLPVPAPATADLLAGAPIHPIDVAAETVTPTGAALLATMTDRWGPIPAGRLLGTARGAGGRDPDGHPNVVTAHLLDVADVPGRGAGPGASHQPAVQLTTNLDDLTPEVIGHVITRAIAAGADDAWAGPIVMKKNRPGVALHVLCHPDRLTELQELVFAETGTLGLRVQPMDKRVLDRRFETVEIRGHRIRIKVGPHGAKPEHEDLVEAAVGTGIPVRRLAAEAIAARSENDDPGGDPTTGGEMN
ncbi:MAG: nickel pincer cofactor biosynthesis protein LarC [Actinomycetota bacterium]